jgi:hypothetical protein
MRSVGAQRPVQLRVFPRVILAEEDAMPSLEAPNPLLAHPKPDPAKAETPDVYWFHGLARQGSIWLATA